MCTLRATLMQEYFSHTPFLGGIWYGELKSSLPVLLVLFTFRNSRDDIYSMTAVNSAASNL